MTLYLQLLILGRFWGAEKSEIAAIQILPVTPVNEYLYDTAWVENVFSYTASEDAEDEWSVACVIVLSFLIVD